MGLQKKKYTPQEKKSLITTPFETNHAISQTSENYHHGNLGSAAASSCGISLSLTTIISINDPLLSTITQYHRILSHYILQKSINKIIPGKTFLAVIWVAIMSQNHSEPLLKMITNPSSRHMPE
jgi:hypothetical protein